VDIVGDGKGVAVGSGEINSILKVVLGSLDLFLGKLVVVISIKVERGDDITESLQVSLASRSVASGVRRTHVGGVFSDDVAKRHFVLDHLVEALLGGDLIEVLVGPSVTGDLMTVGVHLGDNVPPVFIDSALADVVTGDEESCVRVASFELSHD
jgi:hypothetical protein